jgi:hypothetical protein
MNKYTGIDAKEASKLIAAQLKIAEAAVEEAEAIADATGICFSLNIGGYGMGGWYEPAPVKPEGAGDDWEASDGEYGWQASSQSC